MDRSHQDPHHWTAAEIASAVQRHVCSAEEITRHFLERIARYNPALHAYISISDHALEEARAIDRRIAQRRRPGPLAGVPVAIKDLIDTADQPTTYGGRHFAGHRPQQSATVVQRLRDAGAVILGKTNLHEYAYGTTNENPHYGTALNPWNRAKISGGSSGGSAVAVVAGLAAAAVGTDTGGSIRIPAALTGHVGFKPTYGRVSKAGVLPLAPTLDHVGPMTKSAADAALLVATMAGYDPKDPDSARVPLPDDLLNDAVRRSHRPLRIGVPRRHFFERCHPGVVQVVQAALHQWAKSPTVSFVDVEVPYIDEVPEAQAAILSAEALAVHRERLENQPWLFGEDVRQRLESGHRVSGPDYVRAMWFRRRFQTSLGTVFDSVDVLAMPATPLLATDIGQWKTHVRMQEVLVRPHLTRNTSPWNLSGLPAISVPCGPSSDGLPVGLQLVGPPFGDVTVLAAALHWERVFEWDPLAPDYRGTSPAPTVHEPSRPTPGSAARAHPEPQQPG